MKAIPKSSDRDMNGDVVVYRREEEEMMKKSAHRKVKIILIIIIIFLLVCLVAAAGLILTMKKDKNNENDTSTNQNSTSSIPMVEDTTKIDSCNIMHCKVCGSGSCNICEDYTRPIYENGLIKMCLCEIGEGPKCLTVDSEKNECKSCNIGYKFEKGKCILDHHFKATFKSVKNSDTIKIANLFFHYIKKMIINDEVLSEPIKEHIIDLKNEEITVYYKIEMDNLLSLTGFFEGLDRMISISFTKLFNTEKITNMDRMFFNCYNLKSIDLSNLKTPKLKYLKRAFENCHSLTSLDLSSLTTQNIININSMFSNCESLMNVNIRNFNTINVQDMSSLFYGCSSLTSIDLSSFNTGNVESISSLFEGCSNLGSIDISTFTLLKIDKFDKIFKDCTNLKYINMKSLDINEEYFDQTFTNIPSSGRIIVNSNRMKSIIQNILNGWEIIVY